jgi:uncharacterized membrane protein YidH (DUF202 family)
MSNQVGPPSQKISVSAALIHIARSISQNFFEAARVTLPWLALGALCNAWAIWSNPQPAKSLAELSFGPLDFLANAVGLLATASIAVSWHRQMFLDEALKTVQPFRIDRPVLNFAATNFLLSLFVVVPFILLLTFINQFLSALMVPLATALFLVGSIFLVRLSLRPVALAIGNLQFKFQDAFEATRGNSFAILAIFGSVIVCCAIALVLAGLISQSIAQMNPKLDLPAHILLSIPAQLFSVLVVTAMFSTLYRFFVEGKEL